MSNLRKGDKVQVTDREQVYDTYREMAEKLRARNWEWGNSADNGDTGIVRKVGHHESTSASIALVDFDGKEVLIGTTGLQRLALQRGRPRKAVTQVKEAFDRLVAGDSSIAIVIIMDKGKVTRVTVQAR